MLKSTTRIDPPPPSGATTAWATALNASTSHGGVSITLLALAMVDDVMRITAVFRVSGHSTLRVSNVPTLEVVAPDGRTAALLEARWQPQGALGWASWIYERNGLPVGRLDARIRQLEVAPRVGGKASEQEGPWTFHLLVDEPSGVDARPAPEPGA